MFSKKKTRDGRIREEPSSLSLEKDLEILPEGSEDFGNEGEDESPTIPEPDVEITDGRENNGGGGREARQLAAQKPTEERVPSSDSNDEETSDSEVGIGEEDPESIPGLETEDVVFPDADDPEDKPRTHWKLT